MRRFIYLDTDTLNSYLAQIFDGLIQSEDSETQHQKKVDKRNSVTTSLAGKIAFKLFGKGVDANAQATYQHLKTVADDEMVRDVQTKIMHDNAFDQFMNYLHEHNLLNGADVGDFLIVKDEFYIFDIAFYQKLFVKDGFVDMLTQIQDMNTRKEAEKQTEEFAREQRRSKIVQGKVNETVQEALDKNHENWDSLKKMVEIFYEGIKNILTTARNKAYQTANFAMVEAYWNIGKSIIEEQGGNEKAEYGTGLLKELSKQMTQDFGKGFTVANLKNMRQFYLTFPNGYALRSELSWTHYRLLMRVENENAREFYMQEAVKSQWSTRQLERQINSFFYERLLSSKNKEQVAQEIQTLEPTKKPEDVIRGRYYRTQGRTA